MTPQQFIAKWRDNPLKERAIYQLHFIDLCALVGVPHPSPTTADSYCFERGATRTGAGQGWADVWKQGHFAFEYKATRRNLGDALKQLMTYALALDNPPLLVVCDTNIIEIHTHFTNAPSEIHTITLDDLATPDNLNKLRWLFTDPNKFHPQRTIAQITEEAAGKFADLAQSFQSRGFASADIAHFLNQCLFAMFAEDAELLPQRLFEKLLESCQKTPDKTTARFTQFFTAMRQGGEFGVEDIAWFNGGLFEHIHILPPTPKELTILHAAAKLDWSNIEPSIFGTLFERGLDPKKRAQLGAHYTDAQSIMRIIQPVVVEPLAAEWAVIKAKIADAMARYEAGAKNSSKTKVAHQEAHAIFIAYIERLKAFRVLDPACGSGNFLYLALRALKDLEHRANLEAEALGLQRQITIECSPANVMGIEINPYAAELARVTVWIGEIQWMLKNGYPIRNNPILQTLDHIENRDALLTTSPNNLPSPTGRGAGGEGTPLNPVVFHSPLSAELKTFARTLRHHQTDAENLLWLMLRDRRMAGKKFRRQHPVAPYILDFYCHEAKIAVELDGGQHADNLKYDLARTKFLAAQGIQVIRYWNNQVLQETEAVLQDLWNRLADLPKTLPSSPALPPAGEGSENPSTTGRGAGGEGAVVSEADWPAADAIIGNPPFLGDKKMRAELGDEYTDTLRKVYANRVEGGADLVVYWFEKARAQIEAGQCQRAGLVATNSIRGGANQKVLARILETANPHPSPLPRGEGTNSRPLVEDAGINSRPLAGDAGINSLPPLGEGLGMRANTLQIFNAWSDEAWVNDGAAVRVSLVCFGDASTLTPSPSPKGRGELAFLNGLPVAAIHADLSSGEGLNLTLAKPLKENAGVAFIGTQKSGDFDIAGELAREWLKQPNPIVKPHSDVVRPWCNGMDITRRPSDTWIVDFGVAMPEHDAALYEKPFEYASAFVHVPLTAKRTEWFTQGKDTKHLDKQIKTWHLLWCARAEMREALQGRQRYIGTPRNGKYRLFTWMDIAVLPDCQVVAIARSDDTTFGILHSRFHELWALGLCTWLGVGNDPRYTPTTTFETFPFPEGMTPAETCPHPHPSPLPMGEGTCSHVIQISDETCGHFPACDETNSPLPVGEGLGVRVQEARKNIATAAQQLDQLRNNWLNPPEWVDWVRTPEEEKAGYPLRPVAKKSPHPNPLPTGEGTDSPRPVGEGQGVREADLKKRTLTNLYNARPAWLDNAHKTLDAAVAKAYGWTDYSPAMPDDEILRRLLVLNLARSTH